MLNPTHTRKYFEGTFIFIVYYSLCFTIYDKVRGEKFGTHVKQLLDHKPSVILIARLSSFLVTYTGIPGTETHSVWPDENGYRYTEWALSLYLFIVKEQNPILESSPLLVTLSNVPRTYFTNSHLRENSSKNQSTSSCVK